MSFNQVVQNINAALAQQPAVKRKRFYYTGGHWVKISLSRKDHLSGNTVLVERWVDMETAARISIAQENSIPTRSPIDSRDAVIQFNAIEDRKSIDKCELGIFCDLLEKSGVKLGNTLDQLENKVNYVREVALRRSPTTQATPRHVIDPWKITFSSQLQYDAFCRYIADNL